MVTEKFAEMQPGSGAARRLAWVLTYGAIPDGALVCHSCDNRKCVRPDHLFVGSQKDNLDDMYRKSRGPTGERSGAAKLRREDVIAIRYARSLCGCTQMTLAKAYGVTDNAIAALLNGETWRHI